jgi:hypothetical protein
VVGTIVTFIPNAIHIPIFLGWIIVDDTVVYQIADTVFVIVGEAFIDHTVAIVILIITKFGGPGKLCGIIIVAIQSYAIAIVVNICAIEFEIWPCGTADGVTPNTGRIRRIRNIGTKVGQPTERQLGRINNIKEGNSLLVYILKTL